MKKRLGYLLLILAIPAAVGVFAVHRGSPSRKESGTDERASTGRRVDRRSAAPLEELELDRRQEDEDRAAMEAKRADRLQEELEGDVECGELAEYGAKGTKKLRLAKLDWKTGRCWKVETWYLRMQDGSGATWGEKPIVWEFKVRGTEKLDGRDVWVLDVEPTDLSWMPYNPGGTVYVSTEDQSVLAVRDRIQENGLIRERYFKFEDGETSAVSSLLPIALPPSGLEGSERASLKGAPPPDPFKKDPKFDAAPTSGSVVDVEFEVDGVTIRQRWDSANAEWPLYSRTSASVSILKTGP